MELYDTFKELLAIYHERQNDIDLPEYMKTELNNLFNDTFQIIQEYTKYSSLELKEFKTKFEKSWHIILFDVKIVTNEQGDIIETGGTNIEI